MKITDAQALAYGRRELALKLWKEGKTIPQIADRISGATEDFVRGVLRRARLGNDPRAERRNGGCLIQSDKSSSAETLLTKKDLVLNAWAAGESQSKICDGLDIDHRQVKRIVERARYIDEDPRAKQRHNRGAGRRRAPEADAMAASSSAPISTAVSLAPVAFRGEVQSLRPIAYSIDREQSRQQTNTAMLMGDPSPERSALKRPLRPDEWASRGGEGRFSTAFHSPSVSRVLRARSVDQ